MAGLDKILNKISQDSAESCDKILTDAKNKANEILEKAQTEADKIKDEILKDGKRKSENIISIANSTSELQMKNALIGTKLEVIEDVINKAKIEIKSQDAKKYFDSLVSLVEKNALDKKGIMVLSADDLKRKPADFDKKINAVLPKNGEIKISDEPGEIDDGFILKYGDIEINCTLDALIADSKDELKDKIFNMLFN